MSRNRGKNKGKDKLPNSEEARNGKKPRAGEEREESGMTPAALRPRYRIQSQLGEGAQGRTWLATRTLDGTEVAIKELKFIGDFKQIELFQREAEVLESISVKGVPRLFESILGNGLEPCYLVQEYVPYPSLLDVLQSEQKLGEAEVLRILQRIGQILHELENHYVPPIIHRDIKPSNILYNRAGEEVFLIDFGAVANPQKQAGGSTIAGTFGYMAPEQLQGKAAIQSDYYGAGATALHLLTGISPCDMPADVFRLQFDDVLMDAAPKLSHEAAELLHILIAPRLEDRPANAAAFLSMIQNVREGRLPLEQKKKSSWLRKLFSFLPRRAGKSTRMDSCTGQIRALKSITVNEELVDVLEYTYTVDEKAYCGFFHYSLDSGIVILGEGIRPHDAPCGVDRCMVAYDPRNPHICQLPNQTVYLTKTILEKLFTLQVPSESPATLIQGVAPKMWAEKNDAIVQGRDDELVARNAASPYALFYILVQILTEELIPYETYYSGIRSFCVAHSDYIDKLSRQDSAIYTKDGAHAQGGAMSHGKESGQEVWGTMLCEQMQQLKSGYKKLRTTSIRKDLIDLWMMMQTMQWADIPQLLRKIYDISKKVADNGKRYTKIMRDLERCISHATLLNYERHIVYFDRDMEVGLRELLGDWLKEIDRVVVSNASVLADPLKNLRERVENIIQKNAETNSPDAPEATNASSYFIPSGGKIAGNDNLTRDIALSQCIFHDMADVPFVDYGERAQDFHHSYEKAIQADSIYPLVDLFEERLQYLGNLFVNSDKWNTLLRIVTG